jgi:hypothetical protein
LRKAVAGEKRTDIPESRHDAGAVTSAVGRLLVYRLRAVPAERVGLDGDTLTRGDPLTKRRWICSAGLTAAVLCIAAAAGSSAFAAGGQAKPDVTPKFTTEGGVAAQFLPNALTIPHWTFQYTDPTNGATYPITMVGSDPRSGGSTDVHTVIVPLKLNFVAGNQPVAQLNDLGYAGFTAPALDHTFDGGRRVADVLSSPMFVGKTLDADLGGDTGQIGDTFMRAQWDRIGTGYHVRLVNDAVLPTQVIDVPQDKGLAYQRPVGAWRTAHGIPTDTITGVADASWFSQRLQNLLNSLHLSPTTTPIFLTDNVLLYQGHDNYLNCCILGYHGAGMPIGNGSGSANGNGKQPVQTFIYSAWATPGTYSGFLSDYTGARSAPGPTRGLADIHALSHEVAEWLDDPFVNNAVQPWLTPTAPQYGCTGVLETGDPVVGVWFGIDGNPAGAADGYQYYGQYHPEDEVFAQWFGRGGVEQPAPAGIGLSSWDGRLTFMGPRTTSLGGGFAGFASYAQGC